METFICKYQSRIYYRYIDERIAEDNMGTHNQDLAYDALNGHTAES